MRFNELGADILRSMVSQLQYALGASAAPTPQPDVARQCVSAADAQHPEAMIGDPQLQGCPEPHVTLSDC